RRPGVRVVNRVIEAGPRRPDEAVKRLAAAGPVGAHNLTLRVKEAALRSDERLDRRIERSEPTTVEEEGMHLTGIDVGSGKPATGVDAIQGSGGCAGHVDLRVFTSPQDEAVGVAPVIIEVSHYRVCTIPVDPRLAWAVICRAAEGHVYRSKAELYICPRHSWQSNEQA